MSNPNPKSKRSVENGTRSGMKYPLPTIYKTLKILQSNTFNYSQTSKETGINRVTLKEWREKYPEALSNKYADIHLEKLESKMAKENYNILEKASEIALKAIERAGALLAEEKNLDKVSNFLKVITPMTQALNGGDTAVKRIGAIQSTLGKLAQMNRIVEDVEVEDVKE